MKLHRSVSNRRIMGVCGGMAETWNINPDIIRGIWVFLALFTRSAFILIYFLMGFLLPEGEGQSQSPSRPAGSYKPEEPPFDISDAKDVDGHSAP